MPTKIDNQSYVFRVAAQCGHDGLLQSQMPVRFGEERGNRICKIDERGKNEKALHRFVTAAHDQRPHGDRADGNNDILTNTEDPHAGCQSGKFG